MAAVVAGSDIVQLAAVMVAAVVAGVTCGCCQILETLFPNRPGHPGPRILQTSREAGRRKEKGRSVYIRVTHLYQSPVPSHLYQVTCTSHRLTFPNGFLHLRRDRRQQRRVTAVFDVPGFRAFLFHPKGFLAVPQKDVLARPTRFVQIVLGFRQFKPEKRWKMHFVV